MTLRKPFAAVEILLTAFQAAVHLEILNHSWLAPVYKLLQEDCKISYCTRIIERVVWLVHVS
jgi:hypothetical protein